jgi:hypothetical protein
VRGRPVQGGHFFPEEHPVRMAEILRPFLTGGDDARRPQGSSHSGRIGKACKSGSSQPLRAASLHNRSCE